MVENAVPTSRKKIISIFLCFSVTTLFSFYLIIWLSYQNQKEVLVAELLEETKLDFELIKSIAMLETETNPETSYQLAFKNAVPYDSPFYFAEVLNGKLQIQCEEIDTSSVHKSSKLIEILPNSRFGIEISEGCSNTSIMAYVIDSDQSSNLGLVRKVPLNNLQDPIIDIAIIGSLIVLSLFILSLMAFQFSSSNHNQETKLANENTIIDSGWGDKQVLSILFSGLLISIIVATGLRDSLQSDDKRAFEIKADEAVKDIQHRLHETFAIITYLRGLYNASQYVSRSEFKQFVESMIPINIEQQWPGISRLAWIPAIKASDLEDFYVTNRLEEDPLAELFERNNREQITQLEGSDLNVSTSGTTTYYPVLYVEPQLKYEHSIGKLFNNSPELLNMLNLAEKENRMSSTKPPDVWKKGAEGQTTSFAMAVFHYNDAPQNQAAGFIVTDLKINEIIESALKNKKDILIQVAEGSLENTIYQSGNAFSHHNRTFINERLNFNYTLKTSIADQTWYIKAMPSHHFQQQTKHSLEWFAAFFISYLYTFLIALLLKSSIRKHAYLSAIKNSELKSTRQQFVSFMDNQPSQAFILNKNHELVFANKSWLQLFEVEESDVIGKSVQEIFPGEGSELSIRQNNQLLADGQAITSETPIKKSDRSFIISKFLIQQDGNEPLIGGISTEITEQKKYEASLRALNKNLGSLVDARMMEITEKDNHLTAIINNSVDGIIAFNQEGDIVDFNPAAEKIFQYSAKNLIGQQIGILIPYYDFSMHPSEFFQEDDTLHNEDHSPGVINEVVGRKKDKTKFPLEMAFAETSIDENPLFVCFVRDISDRKLAQQLLVDARDAAEAANETKSVFLASMSHELRTPMNGVIGIMDTLRSTKLTSEQKRLINISSESAFSLLRIMDDILDFSKIEAGKLDIEVTKLDLSSLIESVCETLIPTSSNKRVTMNLFIDPEIPKEVFGDSVRIRQVLFNLIGNAIKFSGGKDREGRVVISANYNAHLRTEKTIEFIVSDNGIGMSTEALSTVFKPFTQADKSTTRKFGGTGLGLSITKNLIDLMDGEIEVQSESNKGSTFKVSLPAKPSSDEPVSPQRINLTNERVFCLIEDEFERNSCEIYLKALGAEIESVNSFEQLQETLDTETENPFIIHDLEENYKIKFLTSLNARVITLTKDHSVDKKAISTNHYLIRKLPILPSSLCNGIEAMTEKPSDMSSGGQLVQQILEATQDIETEDYIQLKHTDKKILLVEDNDVNSEIIQLQLKQLGYPSDVAVDGCDGIIKWQAGDYDLILTDCHMPLMDGLKMTSAIRDFEKSNQLDRTTIIALTANALAGEGQRCLDVGMDDYITKPVVKSSLQKLLTKWLPKEEDQPELSNPPATETVEGLPRKDEDCTFDISLLLKTANNNYEVCLSLLNKYVTSSQEIIEEIHLAFDQQDKEKLIRLGHKLKSSSRFIGANVLGEQLEGLERNSKDSDWDEIQQLIDTIHASWLQVCSDIGRKSQRS